MPLGYFIDSLIAFKRTTFRNFFRGFKGRAILVEG